MSGKNFTNAVKTRYLAFFGHTHSIPIYGTGYLGPCVAVLVRVGGYRIAGFFRGRKLSLISRFCGDS